MINTYCYIYQKAAMSSLLLCNVEYVICLGFRKAEEVCRGVFARLCMEQ